MNWFMGFDWQNLIALVIVAIAACSLVKRFALKPQGCGSGCGSCPNGKNKETLVQIGQKVNEQSRRAELTSRADEQS